MKIKIISASGEERVIFDSSRGVPEALRRAAARTAKGAGEAADRAKTRTEAFAGKAKERAGEFAGKAKERAGEFAGKAKERAGVYSKKAKERAGEFADKAKERAEAFAGKAGVRAEALEKKVKSGVGAAAAWARDRADDLASWARRERASRPEEETPAPDACDQGADDPTEAAGKENEEGEGSNGGEDEDSSEDEEGEDQGVAEGPGEGEDAEEAGEGANGDDGSPRGAGRDPFVLRALRAAEGALSQVRDDVAAVRARDPAAKSDLEVLTLYSGVHAVLAYRLAHALHERGLELCARAVSQGAKFLTGIEIHPGAKIGKQLFIDHGTGVVIGETTVIGDRCTIYQGATLGGTGKETGKRHPTVGNDVMIGTGAKVLGPVVIGDHTKIAAGAVVLKDIPPHCTAVGIPARIVRQAGERVEDLDQIHIPDPVEKEFEALRAELRSLKEAVTARERPGE